MKTKEELNALKEEVEALNKKRAALTGRMRMPDSANIAISQCFVKIQKVSIFQLT